MKKPAAVPASELCLQLWDHSSDLILQLYPSGRLHHMNKTGLRRLGYRVEDIQYLRLQDLTQSVSLKDLLENSHSGSTNESSNQVEIEFLSKSGDLLLFQGYCDCIPDADGQVRFIQLLCSEGNLVQQLEDELAISTRQLEETDKFRELLSLTGFSFIDVQVEGFDRKIMSSSGLKS